MLRNSLIALNTNKRSYTSFISGGTPPIKRFVSRLRPSVPRGLSPSTCGSLSTLSTALRLLRVTTSWCQRPWSTRTLLTSIPVPDPVLNLLRGTQREPFNPLQTLRHCFFFFNIFFKWAKSRTDAQLGSLTVSHQHGSLQYLLLNPVRLWCVYHRGE